mmetsp:Transcript_78018/g.95536  ORF Transcript_78018/g.95536 Transcript_78018/m.95536 type:complete len:240 (+) Transcript_78018:253-972(+)
MNKLSCFELSKMACKRTLFWLIIVLIIIFSYVSIEGNETPVSKAETSTSKAETSSGICDKTTNDLYKIMKRAVWKDDNAISQYKVSYDKIYNAIYSIAPKSREPFFSDSINKVKKQDFDKLVPTLKDKLKYELKYEILSRDLDKKIDLMARKVNIGGIKLLSFEEINISFDWGGQSYTGFGILGFIEDDTDPDSIVVGVSIYREEWVEQDDVRLVAGSLKDKDILGFLKYQWYLRMKDK